MKRIGLFVDLSNLYYCVGSVHTKKIDYVKYVDFVKQLGDIVTMVAYGSQVNGAAREFIFNLENLGFKTRFKEPKVYGKKRKADWDVGLTVDAMNQLHNFDTLVLGSADGDYVPLVNHVRSQGKEVIVIGCLLSNDLKRSANSSIEIFDGLLL